MTANETDQFSVPTGKLMADLGPYFSQLMHEAIVQGVEETNARIAAAKARNAGVSEMRWLTRPETVTAAVRDEFPGSFLLTEAIEAKLQTSEMTGRYPGRLVTYQDWSWIYDHAFFALDPRQFFKLFRAATIRIGDVYCGTDKIAHMIGMGHECYARYMQAIRDGDDDATAAAHVREMLVGGDFITSEKRMHGKWTAGSYSNADMGADFAGFRFYCNLTAPTKVRGVMRESMLEWAAGRWVLREWVREDSDFFTAFISDHFDEALNPSHFSGEVREDIRTAVRKRAQRILDWYADENGERRPRAWFEQTRERLKTYWGEDYGYEGPDDEMITIAGACFEADETTGPDQSAGRSRVRSPAASPSDLLAAVNRGDFEAAASLLDQGVDVNARREQPGSSADARGDTPLHAAVRQGNVDIALKLLHCGADVNASNARGVTPLHLAARHVVLANLLLDRGAEVEAHDARGRTPLHWAAAYANARVVETLLEHGAVVDARDHRGRTPLHGAARHAASTVLAVLTDAGADVNAGDSLGERPLHGAAAEGHESIVDALLAAGANAAQADDFGWTPRQAAHSCGHGACARRLDESALALTGGHGGAPAVLP